MWSHTTLQQLTVSMEMRKGKSGFPTHWATGSLTVSTIDVWCGTILPATPKIHISMMAMAIKKAQTRLLPL